MIWKMMILRESQFALFFAIIWSARFLEDMKKRGHVIPEQVLEKCIDRLEKETARLVRPLSFIP